MARVVGKFASLPADVISECVIVFLHAPSKISFLQVRKNIMLDVQRRRLLRDMNAKITEVMEALTPLRFILAKYPLVPTEELLEYQFCSLVEHQTARHILDVWGLEAIPVDTELRVLDWLHPRLRRFECPLLAWIVLNEEIPEVQIAAEMLFGLDWSFHYYNAEEAPVIIITFSHAGTGVCGSVFVLIHDDSDSDYDFGVDDDSDDSDASPPT